MVREKDGRDAEGVDRCYGGDERCRGDREDW